MKNASLALFSIVLISSVGCTDTERAKMFAYGQPHHIKQFSCGQVVGEWDSTGKVLSEEHSDGYAFEDAKTHKIVEISGTVQITVN
jgi:hypothetical protein